MWGERERERKLIAFSGFWPDGRTHIYCYVCTYVSTLVGFGFDDVITPDDTSGMEKR